MTANTGADVWRTMLRQCMELKRSRRQVADPELRKVIDYMQDDLESQPRLEAPAEPEIAIGEDGFPIRDADGDDPMVSESEQEDNDADDEPIITSMNCNCQTCLEANTALSESVLGAKKDNDMEWESNQDLAQALKASLLDNIDELDPTDEDIQRKLQETLDERTRTTGPGLTQTGEPASAQTHKEPDKETFADRVANIPPPPVKRGEQKKHTLAKEKEIQKGKEEATQAKKEQRKIATENKKKSHTPKARLRRKTTPVALAPKKPKRTKHDEFDIQWPLKVEHRKGCTVVGRKCNAHTTVSDAFRRQIIGVSAGVCEEHREVVTNATAELLEDHMKKKSEAAAYIKKKVQEWKDSKSMEANNGIEEE